MHHTRMFSASWSPSELLLAHGVMKTSFLLKPATAAWSVGDAIALPHAILCHWNTQIRSFTWILIVSCHLLRSRSLSTPTNFDSDDVGWFVGDSNMIRAIRQRVTSLESSLSQRVHVVALWRKGVFFHPRLGVRNFGHYVDLKGSKDSSMDHALWEAFQ